MFDLVIKPVSNGVITPSRREFFLRIESNDIRKPTVTLGLQHAKYNKDMMRGSIAFPIFSSSDSFKRKRV